MPDYIDISFDGFCTLNSLDPEVDMHLLQNAIFPSGNFRIDFTVVLYSTEGLADISIDGKDYIIRRKCISVWRPGQTVKFNPEASSDAGKQSTGRLKYRIMLISGELQQHLRTGSVFLTMFVTDEYPVIRITSAYNEAVRRFFDSITIVTAFSDNPYKKDCQLSILRALFYSTGYYVLRSLRFQNGDLFKFASECPARQDGTTARFISLVEKYSIHERRLSFYASELDYNPKYLSALVKRETGHSGQAIIDQYSVLTAMAKLSYGHSSVKEISDEMNFQSQSDFGKFFKRLTGLSPLAYRKNRFKNIQ